MNTNIWDTPKHEWEILPEVIFNPNDKKLIEAIQKSLTKEEINRLNIYKPRKFISQEILNLILD